MCLFSQTQAPSGVRFVGQISLWREHELNVNPIVILIQIFIAFYRHKTFLETTIEIEICNPLTKFHP
jgi:hypothetical protein